MMMFKYLILLSLTLVSIEISAPGLALASSTIPSSCSKIKHDMVQACSKRDRSCPRRTNALNRCIKRGAYIPNSKPNRPDLSVCTMEFNPVCGLTEKGKFQIYSNSCFATLAGAAGVQLEQCQK